ncbi:unnamed protein product [Camellia sinensis]
MSNSSLSSSPARSSISTTAIAGANAASALTVDDLHFPPDLSSIQDRKDEALLGSCNDIAVLKSDLMAALNKEVKSMDEDNWKFDGPRSRIHLISRPASSVIFSISMRISQSIVTLPLQNDLEFFNRAEHVYPCQLLRGNCCTHTTLPVFSG